MPNTQQTPEGVFHCTEAGSRQPLADKQWSATGEYRSPKADEWYVLSSRRREARRAHEDLVDPQWIAEAVAR